MGDFSNVSDLTIFGDFGDFSNLGNFSNVSDLTLYAIFGDFGNFFAIFRKFGEFCNCNFCNFAIFIVFSFCEFCVFGDFWINNNTSLRLLLYCKSWIEKIFPPFISFGSFSVFWLLYAQLSSRGDFNAWVQTRRFACETVNLSNKFQFSSEMIDECPNSFGCLMPLFYLSLSTTHWDKTSILVQKRFIAINIWFHFQ